MSDIITSINTTRIIKYAIGERTDDIDTKVEMAFALDMNNIAKLNGHVELTKLALADMENAVAEYHKING